MKYLSRSMIAVSALALMAVAAEAKTFVYCSEASPEGFDPAPYPLAAPSTPRPTRVPTA